MTRRQFRHGSRTSGVVLDYCREHGVWFDGAELESVVSFLRAHGHRSAEDPRGEPRAAPAPDDPLWLDDGRGAGWLLAALRFAGDLIARGS
jgi:hypothetical protein